MNTMKPTSPREKVYTYLRHECKDRLYEDIFLISNQQRSVASEKEMKHTQVEWRFYQMLLVVLYLSRISEQGNIFNE